MRDGDGRARGDDTQRPLSVGRRRREARGVVARLVAQRDRAR